MQCLKDEILCEGQQKKHQRKTYEVGRRRAALGVIQLPHRVVMVLLGKWVAEQLVECNTAHGTLWSIVLPLMMALLETIQGAQTAEQLERNVLRIHVEVEQMTETENKKEHLHAGKRDSTWKVFLMFRPPHLIQDTCSPPMDESTS